MHRAPAVRVSRVSVNHRRSHLAVLLCIACGSASAPVPPIPQDGGRGDASDAGDAALCLSLTQMSRCAGIGCGPGMFCTDMTQGPNKSGLCGFFDTNVCASCASCACVTIPAGCTCDESIANGVVVDCRK